MSGVYFSHPRPEVQALLTSDGPILDVGCGTGAVGAAKAAAGIRVVGIEPDPGAAAEASEHYSEVFGGLLDGFQTEERFAQVILADVLEHMVDPWAALRRVRDDLLLPGGRVVISLPNVRYRKVLLPLVVRGRFAYQSAGILDRDHLRFFTRAEVATLVEGAGFTVDSLKPRYGDRRDRVISRVSHRTLDGFLAYQWLCAAVSKRAGP